MSDTTENIVLADLTAVKDHFATKMDRLTRKKSGVHLAEVSIVTPKAREIISSSLRKLYSGVIWEDDIRGEDIARQLEIEIIRFKKQD